MRHGFVVPEGTARDAADLAAAAERAGWDGFFVWEPVWGVDAWVALTAAAMRTERIRLGTMLSPLSRMRPWKRASETATLDDHSGGRVILAVGLGAPDSGFAAFGEVTDRRTRAELQDEGLAILTGLWAGQPFAFAGTHYGVTPFDRITAPPLIQQPRIPIWVVGAWPKPKSMRRVARYDGLIPSVFDDDGTAREATPDELRDMAAFIVANRPDTGLPFDIIVEGETPGDNPAEAAAIVQSWAAADATWWLEAMWGTSGKPNTKADVRRRIDQGPPPAL